MQIARLIREARERHGLSQTRLATRAGTTQKHVSRIENGEVSPSIEIVQRLLTSMGERLEFTTTPLARGNLEDDGIRADYERLTPGERVEEIARLSHDSGVLANAGRRHRP